MGRVRRLTAAETEQILRRYGFQLVSQTGFTDWAGMCCAVWSATS